MAQYPLLFTFLDKVEGNDYLADVKVHGRLLAEQEDDVWWMYGVNPGGLAASGKTRAEAYMEFRATLMKVLFDLATESPDFYTFRAGAKRFFEEVDNETLNEWVVAREQVRKGEIDLEGMRRETAETPRRIDVSQKQTFHPGGNVVDPQVAVAA
jgi:hypothetical protein